MLDLLTLVALAAPPPGADTVKISEFTVPYAQSRPRDPYLDDRGRVWFVGQVGNYIAYMDLATKQFRQYGLDSGVHPHNLIIDRNGMVWYAGNRAGHIGKLDPATGHITKYPTLPARDPHTLIFGAGDDIWFTAQQSQYVGRLNMKTGKIDLVHTGDATNPYGIVTAPDGQPWFVLFRTNKVGTIDPATMQLRTYDLPDARTRPRRIARTTDGMIYYSDYSRGYLGRLDPRTGQVKEWALPAGQTSLPYAMTVDEWDRVWVVESGARPNQMVGFDPQTERFFSVTPILPSGGGTVRHMIYHQPTKSIWFGTDTNNLGQAVVTPPQRAIP